MDFQDCHGLVLFGKARIRPPKDSKNADITIDEALGNKLVTFLYTIKQNLVLRNYIKKVFVFANCDEFCTSLVTLIFLELEDLDIFYARTSEHTYHEKHHPIKMKSLVIHGYSKFDPNVVHQAKEVWFMGPFAFQQVTDLSDQLTALFLPCEEDTFWEHVMDGFLPMYGKPMCFPNLRKFRLFVSPWSKGKLNALVKLIDWEIIEQLEICISCHVEREDHPDDFEEEDFVNDFRYNPTCLSIIPGKLPSLKRLSIRQRSVFLLHVSNTAFALGIEQFLAERCFNLQYLAIEHMTPFEGWQVDEVNDWFGRCTSLLQLVPSLKRSSSSSLSSSSSSSSYTPGNVSGHFTYSLPDFMSILSSYIDGFDEWIEYRCKCLQCCGIYYSVCELLKTHGVGHFRNDNQYTNNAQEKEEFRRNFCNILTRISLALGLPKEEDLYPLEMPSFPVWETRDGFTKNFAIKNFFPRSFRCPNDIDDSDSIEKNGDKEHDKDGAQKNVRNCQLCNGEAINFNGLRKFINHLLENLLKHFVFDDANLKRCWNLGDVAGDNPVEVYPRFSERRYHLNGFLYKVGVGLDGNPYLVNVHDD